MVKLGLFSLALAALFPLVVSAEEAQSPFSDFEDPAKEAEATNSNIDVSVSTAFANSELGVNIVNGETLPAVLSLANHEDEPVTLYSIDGYLYDPEQGIIVRNLTSAPQNVVIEGGQEEIAIFPMNVDMQPRDLHLSISALVRSEKGPFYTLLAHDGPVSVVEPDIGFWAIQNLFLYVFLAGFFLVILYSVYSVWITPYLPQKRKPASRRTRTVEKTEATGTAVAPEHSAVQSGTTYNSDWIPAHHLNPPNARKVRGTGRRRG